MNPNNQIAGQVNINQMNQVGMNQNMARPILASPMPASQPAMQATQLIDPAYAAAIEEAKQVAKKKSLSGIAWMVGGTLLTLISYANPMGSGYFIFYGAIVFGLIDFVSGMFYYFFPEKLLRKIQKNE